MHRSHFLLFLLVTQSITGDGRTISKRQAPQSDFVNRMLQMFNFSADGGPGQMLTGLFTMFLNQTSGLFGPLMGMRGGDGMSFFNQLMQQFMSVFGQVSGLWSNRVSRQMASWRHSMTEQELPEYELVQTSVSRLSQVGSRLQRIQGLTASSPMPAPAITEIQEMRRLMNQMWQCLDEMPHLQLTLNVTMMGTELHEKAEQQMIMQMQEELIQLWRLVSEHIAADVNHSESKPSCRRVVNCMVQVMMPTNPPEGMIPSSSTQTIEFEETAN